MTLQKAENEGQAEPQEAEVGQQSGARATARQQGQQARGRRTSEPSSRYRKGLIGSVGQPGEQAHMCLQHLRLHPALTACGPGRPATGFLHLAHSSRPGGRGLGHLSTTCRVLNNLPSALARCRRATFHPPRTSVLRCAQGSLRWAGYHPRPARSLSNAHVAALHCLTSRHLIPFVRPLQNAPTLAGAPRLAAVSAATVSTAGRNQLSKTTIKFWLAPGDHRSILEELDISAAAAPVEDPVAGDAPRPRPPLRAPAVGPSPHTLDTAHLQQAKGTDKSASLRQARTGSSNSQVLSNKPITLTCPILPYLPPHDRGRGGGEASLTGGGGDEHFLTQVQPYLAFSLTQMQPDGGGDRGRRRHGRRGSGHWSRRGRDGGVATRWRGRVDDDGRCTGGSGGTGCGQRRNARRMHGLLLLNRHWG